MFRCELCKEVGRPGDRQFTLVTETRVQTYEHRVVRKHSRRKKKRSPYSRDESDKEGKTIKRTGWEVVVELKVCSTCYLKKRGEQDGTKSKTTEVIH